MWPSGLTVETISTRPLLVSTRPLLVSCVCFSVMRTSKLDHCATDAWQAQVHLVMYRIAYDVIYGMAYDCLVRHSICLVQDCLLVLMPCSNHTLFARPLVCLRRCLMPWALGAQLPVPVCISHVTVSLEDCRHLMHCRHGLQASHALQASGIAGIRWIAGICRLASSNPLSQHVAPLCT